MKEKEPVTLGDLRKHLPKNPKKEFRGRIGYPPHADCVIEVELECECGMAPDIYKKVLKAMQDANKAGYSPTLVDCRQYAYNALLDTLGPNWESQYKVHNGGSHIGIGTMERKDRLGNPDRVIIIAEDYSRPRP